MQRSVAAALFLCATAFVGISTSEHLPGASSGSRTPRVTLVAVGDVLLDRGVASALASTTPQEAFEAVAPLLQGADVAFCNLECPIVAEPDPIPKVNRFAASPESASALTYCGFDVVSLANNHAMDCGKRGLVETMEHLRRLGIAFCGAGMTEQDARSPTFLTVNGLRMAFVGFSHFSPEGIVRLPEAPTIAVLGKTGLLEEIARARKQSDVVIVSLHGGREYATEPTAGQRTLAKEAVAAGADLVIGHHPHVLQPVEVMQREPGRNALVAYSLGNFVFDSRQPKSNETVILECEITTSGIERARTYPCKIERCFPKSVSSVLAPTELLP